MSSLRMRLGAVAAAVTVVVLGLVAAPANAAAPAAAVRHAVRVTPRDVYQTEIEADGVRLHDGSGSGPVIGLLYYGDQVEVTATSGSWSRVYLDGDSAGGLPAGSSGWVWSGYLQCEPSTPTGGVCG
ncbi:SH3 domain-containing protein [Streptantibioticus ferralitis]|uniref:SH3 domain-containing protein n=1 Tax=Streptantibioticus ferralitis TaxID=236510 RepID=A0ABT5YUU5_9ACTN|nr:SH3 domain-containing protein [Streptantibioticus ferralitis]MDF2255355.1 SH3 domain-containing protein [Streptantibioticus ferralitis]